MGAKGRVMAITADAVLAEELKQACALSETQLTPTAVGRLQRLVARLETARLASPTTTTTTTVL